MPKRILFIMHDFSRGGIQSFVYNLIKALPRDTYTPIIHYYGTELHMLEEFKKLDIEIHYFSNIGLKNHYKEFKALITDINPDIIHFQGHEGMFIMFLWLWRMGLGSKIINTFHSTHFDECTGVDWLKEFLVQFCIKRFVHVAKDTEKKYSLRYLTPPGKHTTIYNGIEVEKLQNRLKKTTPHPSFSSDNIHIVGVATFNPQKGYKTGIPAMHKVVTQFPQVVYHIVGGAYHHTADYEWAQEYVKEHNLQKSIILHGVQQDVPSFLVDADIFLSPSEKELMPISFLEALAAGLPIVGTDVGGVGEIIGRDNEWGVLIPPRDEQAIIDAVSPLIQDEKLREEYRTKSLERALFFDAQKIAQEYMIEYEKVR